MQPPWPGHTQRQQLPLPTPPYSPPHLAAATGPTWEQQKWVALKHLDIHVLVLFASGKIPTEEETEGHCTNTYRHRQTDGVRGAAPPEPHVPRTELMELRWSCSSCQTAVAAALSSVFVSLPNHHKCTSFTARRKDLYSKGGFYSLVSEFLVGWLVCFVVGYF